MNNITPGNSRNDFSPAFSQCPQCGLLHPPLQPGEICPNAPIKTIDNKEIDVNPFLAKLKTIFISQMDIKKIKDPEKMFTHLIVEVTKILENYKEN